MFKIGDKVRIKKEYLGLYADYRPEEAFIKEIPCEWDTFFDISIEWCDGEESGVKVGYIEPVFTTWKERYQ